MKLKYIIALIVFFGNLLIMIFEQHTRTLSNRMLLTGRQRMLIKINEIAMYVTVALLVLLFYVTFCKGR